MLLLANQSKKSAIVARHTTNSVIADDFFFVTSALLSSTMLVIGYPSELFIFCSHKQNGRPSTISKTVLYISFIRRSVRGTEYPTESLLMDVEYIPFEELLS